MTTSGTQSSDATTTPRTACVGAFLMPFLLAMVLCALAFAALAINEIRKVIASA